MNKKEAKAVRGAGVWLEILEESYQQTKVVNECLDTRLEYLGEYIFEFTTYDGETSELFAAKALEVCAAITRKETFDYIRDRENYKWFLLMCNMPFFSQKIEWGASIRGCWWDDCKVIKLSSLGIFIDGCQGTEIFLNSTCGNTSARG